MHLVVMALTMIMSLHMKRQGLYANTLERIRGGSELGLDEEFNPLRVPRSRSHVDVEGFGDAIFEASDTFDIINGTVLVKMALICECMPISTNIFVGNP